MSIDRHDFGGRWIDIVGDVVTFQSGNKVVAFRYLGPNTFDPIHIFDAPEPLMFHRHAVAPDGTIAIFGKGNETGAAYVGVSDGDVAAIGSTHGNNPGAIWWDGTQFVAVWIAARGLLRRYFVNTGAAPQEQIPAPWTDTSQGILDLWTDGTPMYMDQWRIANQPPWSFTKPNTRSGVIVGQWGLSGHDETNRIIVGLPGGHVFTAIRDTADDPRVSVLASGRILVGAFTPRGASLAVIDPPYPPHELPPVIVIDPPPPPPEKPMLPDPQLVKEALERELKKFSEINNTVLGKVLNAVALQFPGMGMHRKDGEKSAPQPVTGIGMARDILRFLPPGDNIGFWSDVLGATGAGQAIPQAPDWKVSNDDSRSFVKPVKVVVDPPIDIDPPPPPTDSLETRVSALEAKVNRLLSTLRGV